MRRGRLTRAALRCVASAVLLAGAVALAALPSPVAPTAGAPVESTWEAGTWALAQLGTSSYRCGTDTGYTAQASASFLSGSLDGTALDTVLAPTSLDLASDGTVSVSPAAAVDVGSTPPVSTYVEDVDAAGSVGTPTLLLPPQGVPAGAQVSRQVVEVSPFGTARAAAGQVSQAGALGLGTGLPAATGTSVVLPLDRYLAPPEVSAPRLRIGGVASHASVDQCAALRSSRWGDGADDGLDRGYGVSGMSLTFVSTAAVAAADAVNAQLVGLTTATTTLNAGWGGLTASYPTLVQGSYASSTSVLPRPGASITITQFDPGATVTQLLTQPISDGVVTLDVVTGQVTVDLVPLLLGPSGLDGLAPNTEIVVSPAIAADVATRLATLTEAWADALRTAVTDQVRGLTISASLPYGLSHEAAPGVTTHDVDMTTLTNVGTALDGAAVLTIDPRPAEPLDARDQALTDGGADPAAVDADVAATAPVAGSVVLAALASELGSLTQVLADLEAAADQNVTQVPGAAATYLTTFGQRFRSWVNVQPDVPGGPLVGPGPTDPSQPQSRGPWTIAAMVVHLSDDQGDLRSRLVLARSTAGPVSAP
jgi:hypothetical protein